MTDPDPRREDAVRQALWAFLDRLARAVVAGLDDRPDDGRPAPPPRPPGDPRSSGR